MTRCQLFQQIAEEIWDNIAQNHNRGNRQAEEGLTRDSIIGSIQDFVEEHSSFQVFAQKARNEVKTGADLEIYLEHGYEQFHRVLLQAKLLELDNTYHNLDKDSGSTKQKQYDTLMKFADLAKAKSYYLFYNGIPGFTRLYSDCAGEHDEKQFGCAIVDPKEIKKHCETNGTNKMSYVNVFGPIGMPWRCLTCCKDQTQGGLKRYSKEEIDMDPYFDRILTPPEPIKFLTPSDVSQRNYSSNVHDKLHLDGWDPVGRVFITTQTKMRLRDGMLKFEFKG